MQRQMLKSKIHRATVTDRDPDYVGSITLDPEVLLGSALASEATFSVPGELTPREVAR